MASSLKQFIARRLKENVPLSEIKKDLREKGYDAEAVKKAVREAIDEVGRKLAAVQVIALVVGVVIVIGIGVYLTKNETRESTIVSESTSIESMCKRYEVYNFTVSCTQAVSIALADRPGTAQNISIGPLLIVNFTTSPISRNYIDMWLVDIKLDNPIDWNGKEAKIMRIGVSLDGIGIERRVLE